METLQTAIDVSKVDKDVAKRLVLSWAEGVTTTTNLSVEINDDRVIITDKRTGVSTSLPGSTRRRSLERALERSEALAGLYAAPPTSATQRGIAACSRVSQILELAVSEDQEVLLEWFSGEFEAALMGRVRTNKIRRFLDDLCVEDLRSFIAARDSLRLYGLLVAEDIKEVGEVVDQAHPAWLVRLRSTGPTNGE